MTLDECVYALADLLDVRVEASYAIHSLKELLPEEFTVEQVVEQFTEDYACTPEVYVQNLKDDATFLLDDGFENL